MSLDGPGGLDLATIQNNSAAALGANMVAI